MASESCPVGGEEADADELDPHGHFTPHDSDDNESGDESCGADDEFHGFATEEDYLRSLKQDDSYTFTYPFEYIAEKYGDANYDIDTADMVVRVDSGDAQAAYVISYDVPDMDQIDPGQGNSDAEGFYQFDVYWRLISDLEGLGIEQVLIAS